MVAVPLAMTATMPLLLWWLWPALIFAAWWWADRNLRWEWIHAVQVGFFSTQWAIAGTYGIIDFPSHRLVVYAIWLFFPLLLLGAALHDRRVARRRPPGPR